MLVWGGSLLCKFFSCFFVSFCPPHRANPQSPFSSLSDQNLPPVTIHLTPPQSNRNNSPQKPTTPQTTHLTLSFHRPAHHPPTLKKRLTRKLRNLFLPYTQDSLPPVRDTGMAYSHIESESECYHIYPDRTLYACSEVSDEGLLLRCEQARVAWRDVEVFEEGLADGRKRRVGEGPVARVLIKVLE